MPTRKIVTLYQENNAPIQMIDEDNTDLKEYSNSLSKFMSLSNISILNMSTSCLIIRPSKINSIVVNEDEIPEDNPQSRQKQKTKVIKTKLKKVKEEPVDIITDAD